MAVVIWDFAGCGCGGIDVMKHNVCCSTNFTELAYGVIMQLVQKINASD